MDISIDQIVQKMSKQDRVESRLYCRLLKSKDGKAFMESLKRDIGWESAGPAKDTVEHHNGHIKTITPPANLNEWIGQRQVINGILQKAAVGQKIMDLDME